jgi:hypothetical protein
MIDKPKALALADELEDAGKPSFVTDAAAAELRRLHSDNEQLAEFVIAVGGFWGNTKSKLVGEDSLAECINRGNEDEALLRQALVALDPPEHLRYGGTGRLKAAAITAIKERLK